MIRPSEDLLEEIQDIETDRSKKDIAPDGEADPARLDNGVLRRDDDDEPGPEWHLETLDHLVDKKEELEHKGQAHRYNAQRELTPGEVHVCVCRPLHLRKLHKPALDLCSCGGHGARATVVSS